MPDADAHVWIGALCRCCREWHTAAPSDRPARYIWVPSAATAAALRLSDDNTSILICADCCAAWRAHAELHPEEAPASISELDEWQYLGTAEIPADFAMPTLADALKSSLAVRSDALADLEARILRLADPPGADDA